LACFYSRSDQTELALREVRRALGLNPDLADWSKQDPDLEAIHERDEFKAIIEA
jgi:hypothetical protein